MGRRICARWTNGVIGLVRGGLMGCRTGARPINMGCRTFARWTNGLSDLRTLD